ncbi:hypothetical protein HNP38_001587 [Chryseobacterium defluvii]|uniref:Lipoprotein n=1 Tax=Chryseobacterium defluvii TaxID=160396 RepID=A0A840KCS7_9FLAO|nr:hypothetical protein [Chryseobacterium defluvii]
MKIFFSAFLLLTFFSCTEKASSEKPVPENSDEITFISLSQIGGHLGNYRIIKATKDSIYLEKGSTSSKTHKEWSSTIKPAIWKQLVSSVNVKDLDHILSSLSIQSADGVDETFQIRTPKKGHVYVNAYYDTIRYKQLQALKDQLEAIIPKEYQ